ncbi:MAG: hypothetical protein FVQ82_02315 [Planctomycetes bacterium]|nr:hypothetical protein [Planctomycetota bacterium]
MPDYCPVCRTELNEKENNQNHDYHFAYDCPRCGKFIPNRRLESKIRGQSEKNEEEKRAIVSHAIRKMQTKDVESWPKIDNQLIEAILKRPLPSLTEQANNLIVWFAENFSPGEESSVKPATHQSIVGATTPDGFTLILKYLFEQGLLDGNLDNTVGRRGITEARLTFDGWQYYDEMKRGAVDSRKAFMAMKYGDPELNKIVDDHFIPAVADTGFKLYRLDTEPKAGLIDDRLRVEIRKSRFLISDLSHDNNGAYWEAGYAEGLGKPVIYTCKEGKFDKDKSHFDTNHHLTVTWDAEKIHEAVEMLKATIRATLPDEAKMSDD